MRRFSWVQVNTILLGILIFMSVLNAILVTQQNNNSDVLKVVCLELDDELQIIRQKPPQYQ